MVKSFRPRRAAHALQRGAKSSIAWIAAKAARVVGAGRSRVSHSAGVAGSPRSRRAKMPIFMSRQPPVVLTLAASTWNSTSPRAREKTAARAGESARNRAIRDDSA